ncbi:Sel1 domain protein repeat-containing protein [Seminavis robusta]|uniref:Sel1 domain protein repeat-containing protein n=1 Tax=Seminavis robusta TaxID=568900 RepID=A0A9N8HK99_9STRA|nr:Sel1 domain protein repeat-containing protein [Seminavis robusta]|eukprot:Sro820_g207210.1 Sel1 domain protein repeat-containing protein (305) ;mRNA; r:12432-13346
MSVAEPFSMEDLSSMSHKALREHCRNLQLSADGTKEALRRRLKSWQQSKNKNPADDLICPITLELPVDPVTAEDGFLYERAAIEQHCKSRAGMVLKSPMTNERMGGRLLAAPKLRSLIETLVEKGAIAGEFADKYRAKKQEIKDRAELLKKAEKGDAEAMYRAGEYYHRGAHGFPEDDNVALAWFKKSHRAGNVKGTALTGDYLLEGWADDKDYKKGMYMSTVAAARGSNLAAYNLGMAFADGAYGMSRDVPEAIFWLEKAVGKCPVDHLDDNHKEKAQEKLDELQRVNNKRSRSEMPALVSRS